MQGLNKEKLKELMKKGIVSSVYCSTGTKEDRVSKKLEIEDIDSIDIDVISTTSIQQGYNYSKLKPTDILFCIDNHIQKNHYTISISSQNLIDLLDMINWDNSFSRVQTARLFNQLVMSANHLERFGGYSQDLMSRSAVLFKHHDYRAKDKVWYTVHGTAIDQNKRLATIEEVYKEVSQNYATNVLSAKAEKTDDTQSSR